MALSRTATSAGLAAGLALLVILIFAPIRSHEFILYDDDLLITANPQVVEGLNLDGFIWASTSFHGSNWYPLTRLSWMIDSELFGIDPGAFHRTDLALHLLATLILFSALLRMTQAPGRSAFVAAVFAVHPLHVESVAWASERKDTLSGVFFMLALWTHASGHEPAAAGLRPGRRTLSTSLVMALGLMAKPMLVTLPFVLLLLDAWPSRRFESHDGSGRWDRAAVRRAVVEKWPLFGLAGVFSVLTLLAQRSAGSVTELTALPMTGRFSNACVALAAYLGDSFWPTGLAVFYPHPEGGTPLLEVATAFALVAAISVACLALYRRVPALAVGWFWFLGMLVPVIGLVQVGSQSRADRYTYLPLIGLALAVSWGSVAAVQRWLPEGRPRAGVLVAAAITAISALALTTSVQLGHWRDTESLMRHATRVTEANAVAHAYLGRALLASGDGAAAAAQWRRSAEIDPSDATVANNLAWLLATSPLAAVRDGPEAIRHAERANRITGNDPAVLDTLAAAFASAGRFDSAAATALQASRLAGAAGNRALEQEIRARLEIYRRGQRWVER